MDSFNEAWNIICEYCKNNTTTFAYDVWIKKIEPVGLDFDKGEVTLLVPNDFHRQTLQKCYIPLLNDAFDSVFGTHFQIVFQVPQEVTYIVSNTPSISRCELYILFTRLTVAIS